MANPQRPATPNSYKDRNHGELGTWRGQRAPLADDTDDKVNRCFLRLVNIGEKVNITQMLTLAVSNRTVEQ